MLLRVSQIAGTTLGSPQEYEFFLSHLPELLPWHGWHVMGGSFYTDHLGGCSWLCGPVLSE